MDNAAFENLSFAQKIQLYLLVPMIFWLLLFLFETYGDKALIGKNTQLQLNSNAVKVSSNKIDQFVVNEAVQFIEEKAKRYQLRTESINLQEQIILLELSGAYKRVLAFLQKIKLHYQIVSFEVIQQKETTKLLIHIKNQYFFNKGLVDKEFYQNTDKTNQAVPFQIKLDAIIDNEVFINGDWYNKGEKYLQYKITAIEKKYIKLLDIQSKQIIKVELENESL